MADQEYTITKVESGPREWSGKGGSTFHSYRCTIKDGDGNETDNVEVNYKPDSNPPKEGDDLTGTIDAEAQYGPKFKKASKGGGGGGGGGGRAWVPRLEDDPAIYQAKQKSIARQNSNGIAVAMVGHAVASLGGESTPAKIKERAEKLYADVVGPLAESLAEDVTEAAKDGYTKLVEAKSKFDSEQGGG